MNRDELARAQSILGQYGLQSASVEPVGTGLINSTFTVAIDDRIERILQRVNPIFPASIHEDIEAVTHHLTAKGLRTPRLIRTNDDALCVQAESGVWRLLTYIPGNCHDTLASTEQAHSAGALLASFHVAVTDLEHTFTSPRNGVHDTARHLQELAQTLEKRREHPRHQHVATLARSILDLADELPELPHVPDRIVHGDPKISNVVFDAASGKALCLIDLDTLTNMPVPLELGDAFRSWCNPAGEDTTDAQFSLPLFKAAVEGYASASDSLTDKEWRSMVPATRTILLELAARFCADALNESYFGWDARHYASRGEHNEVRAKGQLAVLRSLDAQHEEALGIVEHAFTHG